MILPVIVKKIETKDGRSFYGASIGASILAEKVAEAENKGAFKGEILPTDKHFSFRPVGALVPQKEGIYKVTFKEGWIDSREGFREKGIVRAKEVTFEFRKDLPDFKKDDAAVANLPKDK